MRSARPAEAMLDGYLNLAAWGFERRIDAVAATIATRTWDEVAELRGVGDPELREAIREAMRRSRRAQADHLRLDRRLPETCPDAEREAARLAATAGIPLSAALKSYRIGRSVSRDAWLDAIRRLHMDGAPWQPCANAVLSFAESYDDRIMELFTKEYLRSRVQLRRRESSNAERSAGTQMLWGSIRVPVGGRAPSPRA